MAILLIVYIPFFTKEPTISFSTFTAINFNVLVLEIGLTLFAAVNMAQSVSVLAVVTIV